MIERRAYNLFSAMLDINNFNINRLGKLSLFSLHML